MLEQLAQPQADAAALSATGVSPDWERRRSSAFIIDASYGTRCSTVLAIGRDGAVRFAVRRTWRSPRTGVVYPVAMAVRVGGREWTLEPLMDDQELDARASTGTLYWEGAVRVRGDPGPGGRGYLELTGYGGRVPY